MEHTPDCLERKARIERENAEFLAAWPNHCKTCGGNGGHSTYDHKSGWDYTFCTGCEDDGKCPRCGEATAELDGFPPVCPKCGRTDMDCGIQEHECWCEELEAARTLQW